MTLAMKNTDDKMIHEALQNLKAMRKFRPWFVILGVFTLLLAGLMGRFVFLFAQRPVPEDAGRFILLRLIVPTVYVAFSIFIGVFLLCLGLCRNNTSVILEHLMEQCFREKNEAEKESANQAPEDTPRKLGDPQR